MSKVEAKVLESCCDWNKDVAMGLYAIVIGTKMKPRFLDAVVIGTKMKPRILDAVVIETKMKPRF